MKITNEKIPLMSLGAIDLHLPLIKIGDSVGKKVLIINNLHGDELTGYFVLEKLLSILPQNITGTLTIIPTANPLGLLHKQRKLPFEEADLNREYPPPTDLSGTRGLGPAIRKEIMALALAHDIILDLHTFMRPCLSATIALKQTSAERQNKVNKFLKIFNTDIIIALDSNEKEERRVNSALGVYATAAGKVHIPIEYPPIRQVNQEEIDQFAQGMKNALAVIGLMKTDVKTEDRSPLVVKRQQIINKSTGLFIPEKILKDKISLGDQIGRIVDVNTLDSQPILSPFSGILTEIADRQFYLYGEKLATVGKE